MSYFLGGCQTVVASLTTSLVWLVDGAPSNACFIVQRLCPFAYEFAYGKPTDRGFQPMQTYSMQHSKTQICAKVECYLVNKWAGRGEGVTCFFTSNSRGMKKHQRSEIQHEKAQTVAVADTFYCF